MAAISRVLLSADTIGGVWTYALELARTLEAQGVRIALATMGAPLTPDQRDGLRALSNVELHESTFRLEWMDEPWEDVERAGHWLLELAARFQPEVVHLNGYAHGAVSWDCPVVVAGHSCVLSWWRAVRHEEAPPGWNRYRDKCTRGLQAADMVVAPTYTMLRELNHYYGPFERSAVIPNGRAFVPPIAPKKPYVFCAGRLWDEAKNLSAVMDVADCIEWPVFVAGDPGAPRREGVRTLGRLAWDEVVQWMAGASIYLLPARYEPFGLSALEAALCGCALVLGDIASLREVWYEDALFVPPDDPVALVVTIKRLIRNGAMRTDFGRRARLRAKELTPVRMANQYLSVYEFLHQLRPAACSAMTQTTVVRQV